MYQTTAAGGRFWSSSEAPRWTDWRGRQAFKYRFVPAKQTTSQTSR